MYCEQQVHGTTHGGYVQGTTAKRYLHIKKSKLLQLVLYNSPVVVVEDHTPIHIEHSGKRD
jgi:hypothetical protein